MRGVPEVTLEAFQEKTSEVINAGTFAGISIAPPNAESILSFQ